MNNFAVSTEEIQILRHSLGLDMHGQGRMYRDYYCEPVDSECYKVLQRMVADGLMVAGCKINEGRDQYFHVTDAGRRKAVEGVKVKRPTRDQRRYQAFLHADSGLRFGEWLKTGYYKHA